jgi:hypothetical protein
LRPRLFVGEVGESKLQLICPFVFYNIFLFWYFETTGKKRTPEIDFYYQTYWGLLLCRNWFWCVTFSR